MQRVFVRSLIIAAVAGLGAFADAPAAAQVSTLDAQRAAAVATFGPRLEALSRARVELIDGWKKYDGACRGKVTTGTSIGIVNLPPDGAWFLEVLRIDNETTPACRMLVTDITTGSRRIERELERIDEDARRRSIFPGVMRDLKRSHGLE